MYELAKNCICLVEESYKEDRFDSFLFLPFFLSTGSRSKLNGDDRERISSRCTMHSEEQMLRHRVCVPYPLQCDS